MGQNVQIGELADAILETLEEYADLAADNVKQAVKDAGETVKKEIRANAPKDTGDYAKSWAVKKSKETSNSITMTVYSRNRYYLAHLLEFGLYVYLLKWRPGLWKEPYCSCRRKGNPAVGGRD